MESEQLLRQYAETGSESAFSQLVGRHIDLVYSTAIRLLNGDAHLAQDITQIVFADLSRKAESLPQKMLIAGWLHRHTYYTTCKALRSQIRRQAREREATEMKILHESVERDADLSKLTATLDEAVNDLEAGDRDAIVLRFFEHRDLRAVGAALGMSDDSAQKRVSRALDKLRILLTQRGVQISAVGLAATLSGTTGTTAPVGLAVSVTNGLFPIAIERIGITQSSIKFMSPSKFKSAASIGLGIVAVVTPLVLQDAENIRLRKENAVLKNQVPKRAYFREGQAQQGNSALPDEIERLRNEHLELLRLRGELTRLRKQVLEKPPTSLSEDSRTNTAPLQVSVETKFA